jgi:hypothetical protein
VGSEFAQGRRVVAILDAVVTRLIRAEPAKLAEWEQLKRVTLKMGAVRGSVSGVDTQPTPVQTSSTNVVAGSGSVVKAA